MEPIKLGIDANGRFLPLNDEAVVKYEEAQRKSIEKLKQDTDDLEAFYE